MKKILSMVLVIIMLSLSLLLNACDSDKPDRGANENQTTDTGTETETETDTETESESETESGPSSPVPSGPIAVTDVNGMNGRQLIERFVEEFSATELYDMSVTTKSKEDGVTTTLRVDMKINETAVYVYTLNGDAYIKVWCVDDTMYVDMLGEKYKTTGQDVDDIFGEGMMSDLFGDVLSDLPESYLEKAKNAQIYSQNSLYYFTVTVTASEAMEMGEGEEGYTETIYVDSTGTLKKIVDKQGTDETILTLNSYGKPVVITAPDDAESYIEILGVGPGDQDPQIYAVYQTLCEKLEAATVYTMECLLDDEPYLRYATDGSGEYIGCYDEDHFYEMWFVGNTGYVSLDGEGAEVTDATEDISSAMLLARTLLSMVADPVSGTDMTYLTLTQGEGTDQILTFEIEYMEGVSDLYTITYDQQMTTIAIKITSSYDGDAETSEYRFGYVNDPDFRVEAPL